MRLPPNEAGYAHIYSPVLGADRHRRWDGGLVVAPPRLRFLKLRYFHLTSTGGAEFRGCGGGEEALEFGDAAGGF